MSTATAPIKRCANLKWSTCSVDEGYWEEYTPCVFSAMAAAFEGRGPELTVATSAIKYDRTGTIRIRKGRISARFQEYTDTPAGLFEEEDLNEADREELAEILAGLAEYGFGESGEVVFAASELPETEFATFEQAIEAADRAEDDLICAIDRREAQARLEGWITAAKAELAERKKHRNG